MTLDELITYALQKDAEKICPPEVVEEFWQGFQEKLAQEKTE